MASGEPSRPLHGASFGSGFGHGSSGWNLNGGGIWGNTAIGSGLKTGTVDAGRIQGGSRSGRPVWSLADRATKEDLSSAPGHTETIKGSGSLLHSSESDSWSGHHASQWKPVDNTSPTLSSAHTNRSTSPMRRQSSNQLRPPSFAESIPGTAPFFINPGPTVQGIPSKSARKPFPDPTSGSFVAANPFDQAPLDRSRHNSDENSRYPTKALNLGDGDVGIKMQSGRQALQNISGYNSGAGSRSGSLPPSRNGGADPSRFSDDAVNNTYSHLGASASTSLQRQNLSAHAPTHAPRTGPYPPRMASQSNSTQASVLVGELHQMNLGRETQSLYFAPQKEGSNPNHMHGNFVHDYSHQLMTNDPADAWGGEENGYQASHDGFAPDSIILPPGGLLPHSSPYRGIPFGTYPHSPSHSDPRRSQHSPFYSTGETPPSGIQPRAPKAGGHVNGVPNGQAALLDRKLRGLQQEQQAHPSQPNPLQFRPPYAPSYEYHHHTLRMNPLAPFYHMPAVPSLLTPPAIPRGPAREHDAGQHVRSALLEEFRTSGKTNKRYELKVNPVRRKQSMGIC